MAAHQASRQRFIAVLAFAIMVSVSAARCISKQTYIGTDDDQAGSDRDQVPEPERPPDPTVEDPGDDDETAEPEQAVPAADPGAPEPCTDFDDTALEPRNTPLFYEVYCDGSPGRPLLIVDLSFENTSGADLTDLDWIDSWRVLFAEDGKLIEDLSGDGYPLPSGPWDLARNESGGAAWGFAEHARPFPDSVCARCDDYIQLEALFTSSEIQCIRVTLDSYLGCL